MPSADAADPYRPPEAVARASADEARRAPLARRARQLRVLGDLVALWAWCVAVATGVVVLGVAQLPASTGLVSLGLGLVWLVLCGHGVRAGLALRRLQAAAHLPVTVVLGMLALVPPVGTAMAAVSLWLLWSAAGRAVLARGDEAPPAGLLQRGVDVLCVMFGGLLTALMVAKALWFT